MVDGNGTVAAGPLPDVKAPPEVLAPVASECPASS